MISTGRIWDVGRSLIELCTFCLGSFMDWMMSCVCFISHIKYRTGVTSLRS